MTRPPMRDDLVLLPGYHSPQLGVAVRLNTNESPSPPPERWRRALAAELERIDWHRYPDRQAHELRAALAQHYGCEPSMVMVANGSNEIIQGLLLAFGGAGRQAAVFEPTYAMHSHISRITGTQVVVGERQADLRLGRAEVDRVFDLEPDVVFLCSPNNPTGILEPEELVRHVADRGREQGVLVVVDEAYGQFAPWSALELVDEDNTVVVSRTFSKTWSMAAARLGYAIGPSWAVEALEAVSLPYHIDAAKQVAGRLALEYHHEMRDRVDRLVDERERLVGALRELGVEQWPSHANFILFRPPGDGDRVWQALLDRGVLVRNCASWPRLGGCLRVTVGRAEENDAFLHALAEILGS